MCHLYPYNNVKLLRKFFTLIQRDRHTPHDGIGRACKASRGVVFKSIFSITCYKRDPLIRVVATHEWILFIAGETVVVLMSADNARDSQQSLIAIL